MDQVERRRETEEREGEKEMGKKGEREDRGENEKR